MGQGGKAAAGCHNQPAPAAIESVRVGRSLAGKKRDGAIAARQPGRISPMFATSVSASSRLHDLALRGSGPVA